MKSYKQTDTTSDQQAKNELDRQFTKERKNIIG